MKVTALKIRNVGKIADTSITLDKPLILFYGEIRQGKSTILNAVRWVCGGEFPDDIIKHGEKEAHVELEFEGGGISRSWYRAKDGTTKARPVMFVRNGKPVSSPVTEIKRLLNPFLLDQDFLRNKSELERKQYFLDLFDIKTSEEDSEIFRLQREAQQLRANVAAYGTIDLTEVKPVDVEALKAKLQETRDAHAKERDAIEVKITEAARDHYDSVLARSRENDAIREHNRDVDRAIEKKDALELGIKELTRKIEAMKKERDAIKIPLVQELKPEIPALDNSALKKQVADHAAACVPVESALENQIAEATAINVRAEQYKNNKARAAAKTADERILSDLEKKQREIKAAKQAKLKTISDSCGIKDLGFDEEGNFIYQGTTAGMISDSQIMKLSSELSALYPPGFSLDLIDRAESLGKSIFEFVDRAKSEKKTILATIVGERPAAVPPEIGVFVVEDGKVS